MAKEGEGGLDGIHLATTIYYTTSRTTTIHSTKGSRKCFWQCQTNISKADVRAKTITEASFHQSSALVRARVAIGFFVCLLVQEGIMPFSFL